MPSSFYLRQTVLSLNPPIFITMKGVIKRLTDKGFGFITPDGEVKDVFFHMSDLNGVQFNDLQVGQAVTFEVAQSDKGPKAVNVTLA